MQAANNVPLLKAQSKLFANLLNHLLSWEQLFVFYFHEHIVEQDISSPAFIKAQQQERDQPLHRGIDNIMLREDNKRV